MTPRTIGKYQVVRELGRGGMGVVYEAQDPLIGRSVAIKSLHAHLTTESAVADRLIAEAKILGGLHHPNVPLLYDLLTEGGQYHMVMELVIGHTLETLLHRVKRLGLRDSLAIMTQAIAGLSYAHDHGISHRDIKPANLMVSDSGIVKVMDFGIARAAGSKRMTQDGSSLGTPAYMSPEQVKGEPGDQRTDIYSLACVLYEMLSGDPPYGDASSQYELLRAKVDQKPRGISELLPPEAAETERALMRALANQPAERFSTIAEFQRALGADEISAQALDIIRRSILSKLGSADAPATRILSVGSDQVPPVRRREASGPPSGDRRGGATLSPPKPKATTRLPILLSATILVAAGVGGVAYFLSIEPRKEISRPLPLMPDPVPTEPVKQSLPVIPSPPPISVPPPSVVEKMAYSGRIFGWFDPSSIFVFGPTPPPGAKRETPELKLFGVADRQLDRRSEQDDRRAKLKAFLDATDKNVTCYEKAAGLYQCYIEKQDIALWALRNGYAKPTLDAPNEYQAAMR